MKSKISFKIRPATVNDVPAILRLVKALAEYEKLADQVTATEELFRKFGFGKKKYYYALIAEKIDGTEKSQIGFALYFFTFSTFLSKPTLYLEDLFVLPEYRGNGVGKALLTALAKIALQRGCGRMEWAVLDWNEPAIQFYKNLGARPLNDWTTFRLNTTEIQKLATSSNVTELNPHSGHPD